MARIRGTRLSETLYGTSGNDSINGGGGHDNIHAGNGNDWIYGADGADTIWGGNGIDTAVYDDSSTGVVVFLGYGGRGYGGTADGDRLYQVENLVGSNYDDRLYGDEGGNVLTGGNGQDSLYGYDGADTLLGGNGHDWLDGGRGADILDGGLGADTVYYNFSSAGVFVSLYNNVGAGGEAEGDKFYSIENVTGSDFADNLWGDDVANVLYGAEGNDTLKGFGGADTLAGGDGDDWLYGMDGNDKLSGWIGNDVLVGGEGDDVLDGSSGGDAMVGGIGNDRYYVDDAGDTVTEAANEGTDIVFSYLYATTLGANLEILSLVGEESVYGTGNELNNTIFGNSGDNVLDGGDGADQLSGLGGNDTFVFHAGQAHGDVVYEFNGNGAAAGDVLRFEGYGTLAQGATFRQLSATEWQITSADGSLQETITLVAGAVFDTTTDVVFV